MEIALIVAVCLLSVVLALLAIKLIIIRREADSIREQLSEAVQGDTNRLITVSGGDASLKRLAADLNIRLAELRAKELNWENGDREVKTVFTNAAHDLRTPLTAISGYLDLLESETDVDKKGKYLSVIRERTDALSKLSEEIFSYSVTANNLKSENAERLDAGLVLKECLADYYEAFCAKGIMPEIDIESPSFELFSDKIELTRMFSNLISNALKYAAGEFRVCLKDKKITFGNLAENVDAIDVNRLFDRFYTVNNGKTSAGLGLSIAKLICERLGGRISASLQQNYLEISLEF